MVTDGRDSSFKEAVVMFSVEVVSVVSGIGVVLTREEVALRRQRICDAS